MKTFSEVVLPIDLLYNICERLLLILVRIGLVWPAVNILMFYRIVSKLVFKILSFYNGMQFSTDLALIHTQSTQRTNKW